MLFVDNLVPKFFFNEIFLRSQIRNQTVYGNHLIIDSPISSIDVQFKWCLSFAVKSTHFECYKPGPRF